MIDLMVPVDEEASESKELCLKEGSTSVRLWLCLYGVY